MRIHRRGRSFEAARRDSAEWRRRGLTPPEELAALVSARLHDLPAAPTYGDFFQAPGHPPGAALSGWLIRGVSTPCSFQLALWVDVEVPAPMQRR